MEHQKSHELEKSTKTIIEDQSMSITPNDSTSKRSQKKTHVCEFCERAFPSISLLTTHIRVSIYNIHAFEESTMERFSYRKEDMEQGREVLDQSILLALFCRSTPMNVLLDVKPVQKHSKHKERLIYIQGDMIMLNRISVLCAIEALSKAAI